MRPDVYQTLAMRTCRHTPGSQQCLIEGALGLNGEAGEVAEVVKKAVFGGHPMDKEKLAIELGDVLWYIAETAHGLGISLEEIMTRNIKKLEVRYPAGKFSTKDSIERRDVHADRTRP